MFEIDHADSNQTNCTINNLSIMPKVCNRDKHTITAQFKQPVIFISGFYGTEYRIRVQYFGIKRKDDSSGVILLLRCNTPEDYVGCLEEIRDLYVGYGEPIYGGQWLRDRPCSTKKNIGLSIEGQKELVMMQRDCFVPYSNNVIKLVSLEPRKATIVRRNFQLIQ